MILEDVSFQPDSCYLDRGYKFFYQKSKNFRLTRCQKYKKINKAGGPIDYKLGPYEVIAGKKLQLIHRTLKIQTNTKQFLENLTFHTPSDHIHCKYVLHSPSQSAPTILVLKTCVCLLPWKDQVKIWVAKSRFEKKQGHCYSKRKEARLPFLCLNNNDPVFCTLLFATYILDSFFTTREH